MISKILSFDQIIGQDWAITCLQKAFANKTWPHCYIFAGPCGVGRFSVALAWARLLLCERPITTARSLVDGCGGCRSCIAIAKDTHPDLQVVSKDLYQYTEQGKGNATFELRIDVVRQFLLARMATRPILSSRRVFIVLDAQRLNIQAQNALLKALEEPPGYCSIILITSRLDQLVATIRSRSAVVRFSSIDRNIIHGRLVEMGLEPGIARYLSAISKGSLGKAMLLAQLDLAGAGIYSFKQEFLAAMAEGSSDQAMALIQRVLAAVDHIAAVWPGMDKDLSPAQARRGAQMIILDVIQIIAEDLTKWGYVDEAQLGNADQIEDIAALTKGMDRRRITGLLEQVFLAYQALESAANERLVWEWLLLRPVGSCRISTFGG